MMCRKRGPNPSSRRSSYASRDPIDRTGRRSSGAADEKEAARIQKFMGNVSNPFVLVRGRAKGNPTLEAVIAEYRSGPRK